MQRVAILGTGPSAAFAVLACRHTGIVPTVFSSFEGIPAPAGAFFFHKVPGAETQGVYPTDITVIGVGRKERYFSKQWGYEGESTFPTNPYTDYGYDPKLAWRYLWGTQQITKSDPFTDDSVRVLSKNYDFVFQTFPTDASRLDFGKYKITYPVMSIDVRSTVMLEDDLYISPNTIIYDGTDTHGFVRASSLFGVLYKEYPQHYLFATAERVNFVSDLLPECPDWDPKATPAKNVYLIGRWAEWRRHALAHEAYDKVWEILHA